MSIQISCSWGLGGTDTTKPHDNCVGRVWAEQVDGVWQVSTWIPDVTTSRPATEVEAAGFEAQVNPVPVLSAAQQVVTDLLALDDAGKLAAIGALAQALQIPSGE